MKKRTNTHILVECAILVALSTVLSFVKVVKMPLGGSVTLLSMLPVCAVSLRHGLRPGLFASAAYAFLQTMCGILFDGILGWGLNAMMLIGCLLFDYILAFSVLGLAGLFRKHGEPGIYAGLALAFSLRFFSHVLSGYVIFRNLDQWELFGSTFQNMPMLYSLCYNGLYMLPELAITLSVCAVLMRFPHVKKSVFSPQV